jgi:lipopolysaccharide/colanic/teichoic acid biosynthesis glycosyltransferase
MSRGFLRSIYLSDMAALGVAMLVGSWGSFGTPWLWTADIPGGGSIWPLVALMALGATIASYISLVSWANSVPRPTYGRALAIVGTTVALTAVGIVVSRVYWSRQFLVATAAAWLILTLAHRFVRRRRPWTESMVLVTNERSIADDLIDAPHTDVLYVLDPRDEPAGEAVPDGVSIVIDLKTVLSEGMAQWVSSLSIAGFTIRALAPTYEEHTGRIPMAQLAEGWELARPVRANSYGPLERVIDVVLVIITAPLWIIIGGGIAVAVRLGSPGPVVYRQEREGRGGDRFTLYKFRTMVEDAEVDGPKFAAEDDPRLTGVGRWLRKTRMDEVPQLWNVLVGDLALVGPRPERPVFVAEFSRTIPFYASRHLVRPGVTGWAQVNYGYADDEADTIEKLTYDLYYVKHMSLGLDLQILGRSIWTVLTGFGAR